MGAGERDTCLQPLLDPNSVPEAEAIPRALGASWTPGSLCAVCAALGWCLQAVGLDFQGLRGRSREVQNREGQSSCKRSRGLSGGGGVSGRQRSVGVF